MEIGKKLQIFSILTYFCMKKVLEKSIFEAKWKYFFSVFQIKIEILFPESQKDTDEDEVFLSKIAISNTFISDILQHWTMDRILKFEANFVVKILND